MNQYGSIDKMADVCFNKLKKIVTFKDKESVRMESYEEGPLGVNIQVNVKNSFGGYTGPKLVYCNFKSDKTVEIIAPSLDALSTGYIPIE